MIVVHATQRIWAAFLDHMSEAESHTPSVGIFISVPGPIELSFPESEQFFLSKSWLCLFLSMLHISFNST